MRSLHSLTLKKPYTHRVNGLVSNILTGIEVLDIISMATDNSFSISKKKPTTLRSSLVEGIGIINLYKLEAGGVATLKDLSLRNIEGFKVANLDGKKVQTLKRFVGDISSEYLYLMEYPGGYVLSLNDELLAFSI